MIKAYQNVNRVFLIVCFGADRAWSIDRRRSRQDQVAKPIAGSESPSPVRAPRRPQKPASGLAWGSTRTESTAHRVVSQFRKLSVLLRAPLVIQSFPRSASNSLITKGNASSSAKIPVHNRAVYLPRVPEIAMLRLSVESAAGYEKGWRHANADHPDSETHKTARFR